MNSIDITEALRFLAKDPSLDPADAAEVDATVSRILARRASEAAEAERARKHSEILERCAEARERFEKLNQEVELLNSQVVDVYRGVQDAGHALNVHRGSPVDGAPYPTAKRLQERTAREQELEADLAEAEAAVRDLNKRRGDATQELLKARDEFERLASQERQLRPRETPEPTNRITLRAVI